MVADPVATFSIVAASPNGDLGVAVASRYFSVGSVVPWAEAGVGAIATQANVNVGYGPRALELLRKGMTAFEVLRNIRAEDKFEGKEGRQVAVVDAKGNVATYTGPDAPPWAGHMSGKTWSVQGNILVGVEVLQAMTRAFEGSGGELSERLFAALKAGDSVGGDSRGRQSAALAVVRRGGGRNTNNDRYAWLNVDDSREPLTELRRLLDLNLAYINRNRAYEFLAAGDLKQARELGDRAVRLAPANSDVRIYLGFIHYLLGDRNAAAEELRKAKSRDPNFKQLWEATSQFRPRFLPVLEDEEFVRSIFNELG